MKIDKNIVTEIIQKFSEERCEVFFVGGYVRDKILGIESKDIDLEIYFPKDVNPDEKIIEILSNFGEVDLVGRYFGIYRLHNVDIDFCIPRTENKVGKGHKAFKTEVNGHLDIYTATIRRDLTINSLLQNAITGEIIDYFGGINDIKNKIIRIINKKTFLEDPLRVLRIAQFKARFDFEVDKETKELCKKIVLSGEMDSLPKERIFGEFNKLLLKSKKPSIGLNFLREINYIPQELQSLINCYQRPDMHPEGDVWNHTMLVIDRMAELREKADNPLVLMYGAICHDIGKPFVSDIEGKSYNHEKEGISIAENFLARITNDISLIEGVLKIVEFHMQPLQLYNQKSKNSSIIRLQMKLKNKISFSDLLLFAQADFEGRGGFNDFSLIQQWYDEKLIDKTIIPPNPIITGKDIIKLGLKPCPLFKEILDFTYFLQIEGQSNKDVLIEKVKEKYNI